MSINSINGANFNNDDGKKIQEKKSINLENIDNIFETSKSENERTTFDETFKQVDIEESTEAKAFLNGLIKNKDALCEKLNLSEEEYEELAVVALGIATQETGMGKEDEYIKENKGIKKFLRNTAIWFKGLFGGASASSGMTQMKINDFIKKEGLTEKQKEILKEFGIKAKGKTRNNLFKNPDKSAIATIVILSNLKGNFENYQTTLNEASKEINENLKDNLTKEEQVSKGNETLSNLQDIFSQMEAENQEELRNALIQWVLSTNGSTLEDKGDKLYNEEAQLKELNEILKEHNFELTQSDLDYIRLSLCQESNQFSLQEYLPYAWNKGTGATGMQLDRILAEKLGFLFAQENEFDNKTYLYSVNVNNLTNKYIELAQENENESEIV